MAFKNVNTLVNKLSKSPYTNNPIGKMVSKNYNGLTGEQILHQGFLKAIPPEKIANGLVKALGVSIDDAKKYVDENSINMNDDGWIDLDEYIK